MITIKPALENQELRLGVSTTDPDEEFATSLMLVARLYSRYNEVLIALLREGFDLTLTWDGTTLTLQARKP
ncbi:MAG: hypothetical protein NZL92_12540 [Gloeomargarita sp. SKYG116]|nr:hypothetical protein [Gloeomargarita sp. SKYG98]MCS7032338.1 hypothetical protein [Gloeomargarita sp. SKYG116]MDW8402508.1 hypothetical protein [Gloeomargarita sp. SKYGB_i_bin116]